jgi:cephalosporin hydroxylase
MLELLGNGRVVGVDVEIRPHNRAAIEAHPMAKRITLVEGSSTDASVIAQVRELAAGAKTVLVSLDSNHTHAHVAAELDAYAELVSVGSYLVVWDTAIEDFPASLFADRPWGPGNSPKTAVREFLGRDARFEIDSALEASLLFSVSTDGYLKRIK